MFFSSNNGSPPSKKTEKQPTNQPPAQKQEKATPRRASSKITERLDNVVKETSPLDKYRSSDLVPLTAEFEQMRYNLRALVAVVKKYQEKTFDMNDAKFELMEQLAKMSNRSPIDDEIGNDIDKQTSALLLKMRGRSNHTTTGEVTQAKQEFRKRQGTETLSLYGLYSFQAAQGIANGNEFSTHVIDYVVEWERIVTERVDTGLKNVKELEGSRRHYEEKVEGLRGKAHQLEDKGKEASKGQSDKLNRNEDKLKKAFTDHEREAGKLCALIEAVTHEGYQDLYPLVKNYIKWEMNRVNREQDVAERMSEILESLTEKMGSTKNKPKIVEQSYEQPVEEPVKIEQPVEEPVKIEQPVEEQPVEEQPVEEPVSENTGK